MKIIHTSDVHIDSPLTARLSPDKIRERRRELISGFSRLISEAKLLGAKAMIIAGDLFDSEKISKRALDTAIIAIESNPDITFFYLAGNHEKNALTDALPTLPKNLLTFGENWTYYNHGGVIIAGRSSIGADMFDTLSLSENEKNIVILHGELRDGTTTDEYIGLRDLPGKNIDYLALGHYHSYSRTKIDSRGVAVYSGTPEGRGFDETGDKGYVIIDTDGIFVDGMFKKSAYRHLHDVRIDISGLSRQDEIESLAAVSLESIPDKDLVRLTLFGSHSPECFKDCDALCRVFSGRFYYFEVKDNSKIEINPEDFRYDKTLKGEFIRTVSADTTLSEEEKARIILCGINALMGEDLF